MKKNKLLEIISICLLVVLCALLFSGNKGIMGNSKTSKYEVAVIVKSTTSSFWKSAKAGAEVAASEYNIDLTFEGPMNEEDYLTQNQMIDIAVDRGADAIVFSAVDYEANAEAVNRAAADGVKIIVIDSDVNSNEVLVRIETDNILAGEMAGSAVSDWQDVHGGTLNVGIVNFDINSENGQKREEGVCNIIDTDDDINVVSVVNTESTIADSKEATIQMLNEHPEINVIVTLNEWTSLGVGEAISELELKEKVYVVAFDTNVQTLSLLETGEVDALVVQNPYAMGYLGVENAYKALNGEKITEKIIDTRTMLITKDNMYDEECQRAVFSFQ